MNEAARRDRVGLLMVAVAAASWGTWSLFLRPTGLSTWATSPVVFVLMGLSMLPSALTAPPARWERTTWLLLGANAVADAVNVVAFFGAMNHTTVAVAVLTHYLTPVLIALVAPYVDGVRVPGAIVAALIATAGLALILEPWQAADGLWLGGGLGALSAVAYTSNVFVVRRLVPRIGAARVMSYHSFGAALLVLPFGLTELGQVELFDLGLLAAGSLTAGGLAGAMFVTGLTWIGSARAAVLTFCEPMVAVVIGWLVWGESLGWLALVGAAMIVAAGLTMASRRA